MCFFFTEYWTRICLYLKKWNGSLNMKHNSCRSHLVIRSNVWFIQVFINGSMNHWLTQFFWKMWTKQHCCSQTHCSCLELFLHAKLRKTDNTDNIWCKCNTILTCLLNYCIKPISRLQLCRYSKLYHDRTIRQTFIQGHFCPHILTFWGI